jgi:hypothetical protein
MIIDEATDEVFQTLSKDDMTVSTLIDKFMLKLSVSISIRLKVYLYT